MTRSAAFPRKPLPKRLCNLDRVLHALKARGLDGIVVTVPTNVFYLSGFYTYGRAYRGRYKALVIVQAVTLAYVTFGFLAFVFYGISWFPRSALVLGWGLTIAAVLTWFAALATGSAPWGLRNLSAYALRYGAQVNAYLYLLTDAYPHASPLEGAPDAQLSFDEVA